MVKRNKLYFLCYFYRNQESRNQVLKYEHSVTSIRLATKISRRGKLSVIPKSKYPAREFPNKWKRSMQVNIAVAFYLKETL
jgi:hypothetical protein